MALLFAAVLQPVSLKMGEIDDLLSELEKLSSLYDQPHEIAQRIKRINGSIERILS